MFRLRVDFPASGTVYTLIAEAGAYAMTGQPATLTYSAAPAASLTLSLPTVGLVGSASAGEVQNTGGVLQNWTLYSPTATITPASGTTPPGASTAFSITAPTAASHSVVLTNTSGGAALGTPGTFVAIDVPVDTGDWKYRHEHPSRLLFQRYDIDSETITYTNHLGQLVDTGIRFSFDGTSYGSWAFGPNAQFVCRTMMWPWANTGGDFTDADGIQQGPTPHTSITLTSGSLPAGASAHAIDVTSAVQDAYTRGKWIALLLKMTGIATLNVVGSLEAVSQELTITYSDASTDVRPVWVVASLVSQQATNTMKATVPWTTAAPLVMEFFGPEVATDWSKTVTAAELTLRVASASSAGAGVPVTINLVAPPIPDTTPVPGPAALYPLDAGIEAIAGYVMHIPPLTDASVIEDVLDTRYTSKRDVGTYDPAYPYPVTQHAESQFTPYLWGNPGDPHMSAVSFPSPAQETLLHPARSFGRFVGDSAQDRFRVVHSDDVQAVADGYVPLHPDLGGAIEWRMKSDGIENGQTFLNGTTDSYQNVHLYLPKDKFGKISQLTARYYLRFGRGFRAIEGDQKRYHLLIQDGGGAGIPNNGKYPEELGLSWTPGYVRATDRMGKGFGGLGQTTRSFIWKHYNPPTQRTTVQNVLTIGGGGYSAGSAGHSGRYWFREGAYRPNLPGPANEGLTLSVGPADFKSDYHSIEEWRYTLDQWTNGWQTGSTRYGCLGQLYPDRWYCVEVTFKANTITEYTEPSAGTHYMNGSGYLADGNISIEIDGIPAGLSPDFAFRSGRMLEWAWQTANGKPFGSSGSIRPVTNITDLQQYMGFASFLVDFYYGGTAPNPVEKVIWMNGLVLSEQRIGPMAGVSRFHGGLGLATVPTGADIWIGDAAVGEWGVIPGNTASAVNPDNDPAANPNHPAAAPWRVTGGQNGLMAAWCGMCFDQTGGVAWVPNGEGHNDGWSNAVYKWDLDQATPAWVRVKDPSVVATYADGAVASGVYSDGRPRALHTYNYTEYIPGYGPAVCNEIALANTGGSGPGRLYLIDEVTGDHTFRAASTPAGGSGAATCYDSTRGVVWMRVNGTQPMRYWTPATNTWASLGSTLAWAGASSLCYMPDSDCILIGNGENELGQTVAGGWCVFDCAAGTYHYPTFTGAPALNVQQAGGLWPGKCQPAWDETRSCAYAWDQDSGSTRNILRLTPGANPRSDAWTLDVVTVAPTNTVTPSAAQATGTYGRAFYWAAKQVFIVVNDVTQNGYFFRIG